MIPIPQRHKPQLTYNGLTIVLDKPSRFDSGKLISGNAGQFFENLLMPLTRFACDIRLLATITAEDGFLPETKVVLLLGEESLRRFKSTSHLLTYRGSPFKLPEYGDLIFLPTIPPQESFDRKNYENPEDEEGETKDDKAEEKDYQKTARKNFRFWLSADIRKAIRILKTGLRKYPEFSCNYCPNPIQIINGLISHSGKFIFLDIETDPAQNLTVFSLLLTDKPELDPNTKYEILVIPFKRYTGLLHYTTDEYCHIFRALTLAFSCNTVVGHNVPFDLFVFLFKYKINPPKDPRCTMIQHHRLHSGVEKSLGHCTSYYTDLPFHKDEGSFDPKTHEQEVKHWRYNGKDTWTCFLVFCEQVAQAKKIKGAEESFKQANGLIRSCLMMQYEGCLADTDKLCKIVDAADEKFEQYKRILRLLTGRDFNPRSSDQCQKYFYDTLKLPEPPNNPTKEENLLKLYVKNPIPSLRVVLAARGEGKEASSLRKIRLWKGNRFTCLYKITGTEFYRLSSTQLLGFKGPPAVKGYGGNLQNWNKRIRPCVVAPPGYIMWQIDQSGAEALIVAYECRLGRFRKLFLNKIKPHTFVAMHLRPQLWAFRLGIPNIDEYLNSTIDNLKTLPHWNDLAKIIADTDNESDPKDRIYAHGKIACHQLNYDAMWQQFQLSALIKSEGTLAFSDQESKVIHSLYRERLFPEITDWHGSVVKDLQQNGRILYNLFGYPIEFSGGGWDRELFKQAYAAIPQSTVGCIAELAQIEITQRLDDQDPVLDGVSIWQNGHDSLMGIGPEETKDKFLPTLVPHIARDLTSTKGEKFKMGCGVSVGKNWGSFSEKKNPLGLVEIKL